MSDEINFFAPEHPPALLEFTQDMLDVAIEHELYMQGMSTAQQSAYMSRIIRKADVVVVVFKTSQAPLGRGLMISRGSDVLDAAGFDLSVIGDQGRYPPPQPRHLNRPIEFESFLVETYQQARFFDIAWGDGKGQLELRRQQRKLGGEQAVSNMREAVTPAGRAYCEANPHLWR